MTYWAEIKNVNWLSSRDSIINNKYVTSNNIDK